MLSSLIIVFREVLEAALIIGIVCAATRGMDKRFSMVAIGIILGALGAVIVALFADVVADFAEGMGQELFNASVLLTVVVMLAWHLIWMAQHGAELASRANKTGSSVREGSEPLTVLILLVGLAVLREGAEVVLFLYGIAAGGSSASMMIMGSLLGLVLGVLVGFALYGGLIRIPTKSLFAVSSALLVVLAAGMAGKAAKYLIQGDFIPALGYDLWDTSALISNNSIAGEVFGTLIGYDAKPAGMQVVFYVVALVLILAGMWWAKQKHPVASLTKGSQAAA